MQKPKNPFDKHSFGYEVWEECAQRHEGYAKKLRRELDDQKIISEF